MKKLLVAVVTMLTFGSCSNSVDSYINKANANIARGNFKTANNVIANIPTELIDDISKAKIDHVVIRLKDAIYEDSLNSVQLAAEADSI